MSVRRSAGLVSQSCSESEVRAVLASAESQPSHWLVRALLSQLNLSAQTKRGSYGYGEEVAGAQTHTHTPAS